MKPPVTKPTLAALTLWLVLGACSNPFATEGPPVHIVQSESNRIPEALYDQVNVANDRDVALFLDGENMTWTFPDGSTITGMEDVSIRGMTESPGDPAAHDMSMFVFSWQNTSRQGAVDQATPVLDALGLESEQFIADTLEAEREGSPYIAGVTGTGGETEFLARIHWLGEDRVAFSVQAFPVN